MSGLPLPLLKRMKRERERDADADFRKKLKDNDVTLVDEQFFDGHAMSGIKHFAQVAISEQRIKDVELYDAADQELAAFSFKKQLEYTGFLKSFVVCGLDGVGDVAFRRVPRKDATQYVGMVMFDDFKPVDVDDEDEWIFDQHTFFFAKKQKNKVYLSIDFHTKGTEFTPVRVPGLL